MNDQLTLDMTDGGQPGSDFFLSDASNQEAFDLCEATTNWASSRLVLQGPAKSGKSLLAEVARLNDVDIVEDVDLKLTELAEGSDQKSEYEKDLFHRLNWADENNSYVLLTAQKPAIFWQLEMPDLSSRLLAAPQVTIEPPSDALFMKLLAKHFSARQVLVDASVVSFIALRIERSHKAAFDVVKTLDREALKARKKLTLPFVRQVLIASF